MKKKYGFFYLLLTLSLFWANQIIFMVDLNGDCIYKNSSNSLQLPIEINIIILERAIVDIICENNIFDPLNKVKEFIYKVRLVNKEFLSFTNHLINFTKRYSQEKFALKFLHLTQDEKDLIFKELIFKCFNNFEQYFKELCKLHQLAKLIIAGANLNIIKFDNKRNLLMEIILTGKFHEIVNLLLKYSSGPNRIDINDQDCDGNTALMLAIKCNNKFIAELLINLGAKLDIKNKNGNTALMIAIMFNFKDIVRLIINAQADLNIQNNEGFNALIIAEKLRRYDLINMFRKLTSSC